LWHRRLEFLAAESYPTATRSGLHGLSSGIAKVGAFAGALLVPLLLAGGDVAGVRLLHRGNRHDTPVAGTSWPRA
jgi:hypothetical protein